MYFRAPSLQHLFVQIPKQNMALIYFSIRIYLLSTKKKASVFRLTPLLESGDDLLSRAVSSQVPSALRGLTSVFGMGTGGSLLPLSPEIFIRLWISLSTP